MAQMGHLADECVTNGTFRRLVDVVRTRGLPIGTPHRTIRGARHEEEHQGDHRRRRRGGTADGSEWRVHDEQDMGRISAGSVSLSGTLEVLPLPRQPVNSRTFASVTTCPAPPPSVLFRVLTPSLPNDTLLPVDP